MSPDPRGPLPPEQTWGEPPAPEGHALALAEQLLEQAEVFANDVDYSAACLQARCALEGLEALVEARPSADDALLSMLERARHELGLHEARWAVWQQGNSERNLLFGVHERLALKKVEAHSGFVLDKTEFRPGLSAPVRCR